MAEHAVFHLVMFVSFVVLVLTMIYLLP